MKKVPAFQAEDGTLFLDRTACLMHDRKEAFTRWYNTINGGFSVNSLSTGEKYVEADRLLDYLIEHRTEILALLADEPPIET